MQAIFHDAIDLIRGRVQPLAHYNYPPWQPAILLLLSGLLGAAGATDLGDDIAGRLMLFTLLGTAESILLAGFMRRWLKFADTGAQRPLFGIIVAVGAVQLLSPLASWLPGDVADAVTMVIALFGMLVMINALAAVSGNTRVRVLLGTLLFSPIAALLMMLAFSAGESLGWIILPVKAATGG
ncbi:hypothetical protein [Crenobacter caeni]|uniref:Yip1 domain-containing protein n=1 Tax=Crenobacter caeni TaxID=2705474 RepID=A0A6B2KUS1_9NEIS|nr:hypothetical protein [Crenobacter caeni]NDV13800.1 hypothetical protein [Crenobacter caeni]